MPKGANGQVTIDVSARLQLLRSSVDEIQKTLDKLKPDSSGFKELTKILTSARKEIDQLQVQASKPFGSQKQFDQAEKTIDKVEDSLERAKIAIERINFSDLKLSQSQIDSFEALKQRIIDIKKEFTNFKEAEKLELFKDNDFKQFADSIDANLISKNFDQVIVAIEKKTNSIDKALEASLNNLNKYSAQIKVGENIKDFIKKGGISEKSLGQETFSKMFTKNSTFKAGGKNIFFEYLKEQFSITDSQLAQLKDLSAPKIQALISSEDFWKPQLGTAEKAAKNQAAVRTEYTRLGQEAQAAARANKVMGDAQERVADKSKETEKAIKDIDKAEKDLQNGAVGAIRSTKELDNAYSQLESQLQGFKDVLAQTNVQFLTLQRQQQTFNSIKTAITNFMGFNQVLNLTKIAVREAMNHIKELDTTMNGIAIVSDMTTADLWKQIDTYSQIAQTYGTTIQGAYEVSKIYYQAGYKTNDVLTLMNETLKLSKISGLDYAAATDYMMTATRGFHMEISEASKVVDVYSALAANTAVSQEELAVAMSKTSSSMESVGSTFEDTSSMIATMVAVTRESATNIGSAMKSIASRYGELTKDPKKLFDAEGEEMSFNKVDAALKSVGISLQTADHQFRDFTDVILELSEVWDTLESTQQRYIATQFAGNRQQSRFLALVSNADLLRENMRVADESEDTGTLQALKALDSLESKINQVQVAYQQFYTTIGAEQLWKTLLDGLRNFIDSLNSLPKLFNTIPLGAVTVISDAVSLIRTAGLAALSTIAKPITEALNLQLENVKRETGEKAREIGENISQKINEGSEKNNTNNDSYFNNIIENFKNKARDLENTANLISNKINLVKIMESYGYSKEQIDDTFGFSKIINGLVETGRITQETANKLKDLVPSEALAKLRELQGEAQKSVDRLTGLRDFVNKYATSASGFGAALNVIANALDKSSVSGKVFAGVLMTIGGAIKGISEVSKFLTTEGMTFPWLAVATAAITVVNGLATAIETSQEKLERLIKEAEDLNNEAKKIKSDYNTLQRAAEKLDELKEKRYESIEAEQEYQAAVEELAEKFPQLITGLDETGQVTIDTIAIENQLQTARDAAMEATLAAVEADRALAKERVKQAEKTVERLTPEGAEEWLIYTEQEPEKASGELSRSGIFNEYFLGQYADFFGTNAAFTTDANRQVYINIQAMLEDIYSQIDEAREYINTENGQYYITDAQALGETINKYFDTIYGDFGNFIKSLDEGTESLEKTGNVEEINKMIINLSKVSQEKLPEKIAEVREKIYEAGFGGEDGIFDSFEKWATNYLKGTSDLSKARNELKGYEAEEISNAIQKYAKSSLDFYGELGEGQSLLISYLSGNAESYSDIEDYFVNPKFQKDIEKFSSEISDPKKFAEYYSQRSSYTFQNFIDAFGLTEDSVVYKELNEYFNELDSISLLANRVANLEGVESTYDFTDFTESATSFVNKGLEVVEGYFNKGYDDYANGFLEALYAVGSEETELPAESKAVISNILKDMDFTQESINDTIKTLEEIEGTQGVRSALENLKTQLIINLPLSIQTVTSAINSEIEDAQDLIKKAFKGFKPTEINTVLQKVEKYGYAVDDLILKDGQYYLPADVREAYITAIIGELTDTSEEIRKETEKLFAPESKSSKTLKHIGSLLSWNKGDPVLLSTLESYSNYSSQGLELAKQYGAVETYTDENGKEYIKATKAYLDALKDDPSLTLTGFIQARIDAELTTLDSNKKALESAQNAAIVEAKKESQEKLNTLLSEVQKGVNGFISKENGDLLSQLGEDVIDLGEPLEDGSYQIKSIKDEVALYKFILEHFQETGQATKDQIATARQLLYEASNKQRTAGEAFVNSIKEASIGEELLLDQDQFELLNTLSDDDLKELGLELNRETATIKRLENSSIEAILKFFSDLAASSQEAANKLIAEGAEADWNLSIDKVIADVIGDLDNISFEAAENLKSALQLDNKTFNQLLKQYGGHYVGDESLLSYITAFLLSTQGAISDYTKDNLTEAENSLIDNLQKAGEALESGVGARVDDMAKKIGDAAGYTFEKSGSKWLITSVGDVELAHQLIYDQMVANDYVTVEQLNEARENLVESHRKEQTSMLEELENIEDAKGGDWLDFTNFSKDLTEAQIELLNNSLGQYGAVIQDGILKIEEGANILGIQQILYKQAQESGKLLDSELAGLRDAIINTIAGYSELISNGIAGSLTQADVANLQAFASNYNLQIDFHQTEEGLKLSQKSANELYLTMKQVDYLQSRVLFKDLSDNLKESRDAYKDVVSIQGHIADLQREINSLPVGSARRKEYEQELEVAKEIREVRSLTDEDAFDFMGRDLPTPYKAQLGYWDSIGSAFKEMNDAAESGYMDVTKFYNMINGFNEMASNMGSSITFMGMELDGSMESASKLIQKGFDSLSNVDGDGAKISMKKMGADIYDGAGDMQKNVKKGVREMAKSQIEFLNAQIAMLELVVAMEELEPGDKDKDNRLSMEELFPKWEEGDFTLDTDMKGYIQKILDLSKDNKDLSNALDSFIFEGKSMREWMEQGIQGNIKNEATAEVFQATLSSLYTALKTGDFSPDTIKQNIIANLQENIKEGEWREFTLTDGTKVKVSQKGYIEQSKKGEWIANGRTYSTYQEAEAALEKLSDFAQATGISDGEIDSRTGQAYKEYEIERNVKVRVTQNADGEINTVLSYGNKQYSFEGVDMRSAVEQIMAEKMGISGPVNESDLLEMNLISKLNLTLEDVEVITGQSAGQLSDKTLTALGIDTTLVNTIKTGIQRAFIGFDFIGTILDNLLGPQNEETSTWEDNPKLQEVGRQLGTGIVRAVIDGVTNETETNPNGVSSAVASGIEDKNGEVEGAANNLAGVVTGVLTALSDPNGAIKNAGMNAAQSFVEGFTLTNSNDGISSFSEVFGQQISSAVIGPIRDALIDLFSETSLSEIIPLFATNSDLTLTFDSIKIDSLIEITNGFKDAISAANEVLQSVIDTVNELKPDGPANAFAFKEALNNIRPNGSIYASSFQRALNDITNNGSEKAWNFKNALEAIGNIHAVASIEINITGSGWSANAHWEHGLAKGNALAKGHPTLMGELGPELYVTGGRYYVAGQNGAEMVDLPDDAIVFNHLQTKRLLGSGHAGRGKPVTNEKNAVSYATGNVSGPALASARETLNMLKALRSMWESMLNASFKDLGGLAKSNKDKSKTDKDPTDSGSEDSIKNVRTSDDLQRWYNLTRQIDKLEKDIAYQESLINNYQNDRVANGKLIHASYKNQLNMLDQELAKNRELYKYQSDFAKQKRKELENSAWSKILSFDESGLLQLHGMDILERLNEENIYGEGINTSENVQQQLRYLSELGFDLNDFKYNDDDLNAISRVYNYNTIYDEHGNALTGQELIDAQKQIMENFWSQLDAQRDEYDEAFDALLETQQKNLELLNQQNEILQKYVDNQLEVENTILDAIVDARQAEIDELQKQRDAYEDSVNKMIEGLDKALDNERRIYKNQQSRDDLTKLQRQLAILQRSGGSTSQIRNLQNQISSKQQDMYFDRRQEEIDAIQEASDKQLAAMETQINLMTETLEYQKQHGLLWNQVYQVMSLEESQILSFISGNSSEWASKSTLAKNEDLISLGDKIGLWIGQRDDNVDRTIGERLQNSQNTLFENIKNLLGPEMADFEAFLNAKGVDWRTAGEGEIINAIQEWGLSKHNESLMNRINEIVNLCTTLTERDDSSFNPIEESEVKEWLGEVEPPKVEVNVNLGEGDEDMTYDYSSTNSRGTVTKTGNSNGQTSYQNNTSSSLQNVQESSNKSSSLIGRKVTDFSPSNKFNIATKSNGSGSSFTMTPGGSYDFNIAKEGYSSDLGEYYKLNKVKTNGQPLSPSNWYVRKKDLDSLLQYKNGGLIDFTGPAWVDGSRTKPEAILSAEDTAALRNGLLGTKINLPQISTSLQALQELLTNHSNSNTSITDGNIYIDTVELNMQAQIANDYDANRAGQQVLNEFVRLARKNGVNSVSRR